MIGPLAASGLMLLGFGLPTVFLASAVPALAACLVAAFVVREAPRHPASAATAAVTAPPPAEAQVPAVTNGGRDRLPRPSQRPFAGYLVAVTVFSMAGSADAFLVLRAHELGFSAVALPALWALHNGVKAITGTHGGDPGGPFRPPAGAGRRLGHLAGVYAGFGWANSHAAIIALFVVYGLHRALVAGAQKALVADLVPAASRARGYGLYYTCVGLTLLPASILFGLLYQTLGSSVAFATGAALALLATVLLPLSRVRIGAPGW